MAKAMSTVNVNELCYFLTSCINWLYLLSLIQLEAPYRQRYRKFCPSGWLTSLQLSPQEAVFGCEAVFSLKHVTKNLDKDFARQKVSHEGDQSQI